MGSESFSMATGGLNRLTKRGGFGEVGQYDRGAGPFQSRPIVMPRSDADEFTSCCQGSLDISGGVTDQNRCFGFTAEKLVETGTGCRRQGLSRLSILGISAVCELTEIDPGRFQFDSRRRLGRTGKQSDCAIGRASHSLHSPGGSRKLPRWLKLKLPGEVASVEFKRAGSAPVKIFALKIESPNDFFDDRRIRKAGHFLRRKDGTRNAECLAKSCGETLPGSGAAVHKRAVNVKQDQGMWGGHTSKG